ncbi:hypothetical protein LTR78_008152 [Recurvomyces mirabilis]|uniref:Uncharacterized protein n=1 Tax=Recurvomyces mirabilis TaxID=574656 RepID=A0AAE0TQN4_9PEZI|nr:hypothetical protein LTR78_008152 [Recurvomyces mirabilis]KAK5150649.1 hypothetical protein LTS14_009932 [Recurvomyces mirabilis]
MIRNNNSGLKRKRQSATPTFDNTGSNAIDLTEDDATPVADTSMPLSTFRRHESPLVLHSSQVGSRTLSLNSNTTQVSSQHSEKQHQGLGAFSNHSETYDKHLSTSDTISEDHYDSATAAIEDQRSARRERESNGAYRFDSDKQSLPAEQALSITSMNQANHTVTVSLPASPPVMSRLERRLQQTMSPALTSNNPVANRTIDPPTRTDTPVLDVDTDMIDVAPQRTQPEQNSQLCNIPELASPYIPHTSMRKAVEYSNPQKFSLKPPFWNRWSTKQYSEFAEDLREQFDPIRYAQKLNVPVEEMQHMFTSLVTRPLHHAAEAARRGEEGMQEIMDLSNKFGGRNRRWGRGGEGPGDEPVYGELAGIEKQTVILTTEIGWKRKLRLGQLSGIDVKFLQSQLLEQDKPLFWHGEAETETDLERLNEKYGSRIRHWGARNKDGKRLFGAMAGIERGVILVQTKSTTSKGRYRFKLEEFVEADDRCLEGWLSMAEQRVLRAEEDEEDE